MSWFRRNTDGIKTTRKEQIQAPDGLWIKCPECKNPTHFKELAANLHVCGFCGYHHRIGSSEYFKILFDENQFDELDKEMRAEDPLEFSDTKAYTDRLSKTREKTNLQDAIRVARGKIADQTAVVAAMDFSFIGGSMGSVVGEKIARGIDTALEEKIPMIIISKSGGARMMEGALSLMQMAKTSAKLAQLAEASVPYISLMTHPTTGGVTASFAMLGDVNLSEPRALIGFAGPRVIRETIGKDLPEGFQSAEFLLEHGFLDAIVHRAKLKKDIARLIKLLQ